MFEKKKALKELSAEDTAQVSGGNVTIELGFTESRLQKPGLDIVMIDD